MALFQIHWQNRSNKSDTIMVAQGEFKDVKPFQEWMADVLDRRISEMPAGYSPLVLTEDSDLFWLAPKKA